MGRYRYLAKNRLPNVYTLAEIWQLWTISASCRIILVKFLFQQTEIDTNFSIGLFGTLLQIGNLLLGSSGVVLESRTDFTRIGIIINKIRNRPITWINISTHVYYKRYIQVESLQIYCLWCKHYVWHYLAFHYQQ